MSGGMAGCTKLHEIGTRYLIAVRSRNPRCTGRKMALERLLDPVTKLNGGPRNPPILQTEGRYSLHNHHCNTSYYNHQPLKPDPAHPKIKILTRYKHRNCINNTP